MRSIAIHVRLGSPLMLTLRVTALCFAAACVLPGAAQAFTGSVSNAELRVIATAGASNHWTLTVEDTLTIISDTAGNTPTIDAAGQAAGCSVTAVAVRCPTASFDSIKLDSGDMNDTIRLSLLSELKPILAIGGAGTDTITLEGTSQADKLAFDQLGRLRRGETTVLSFDTSTIATVEQLVVEGGDGNDVLDTRYAPVPGLFDAGRGNDTLGVGSKKAWQFLAGADLDTLLVNGSGSRDDITFRIRNGSFQVHVKDGIDTGMLGAERLTINGNGGADTILLERNLGRVLRGLPTATTPLDITVRGGAGDDTIIGSVSGDRLFGDAGNDTIFGGGGGDHVAGGSGNDVIHGGFDADRIEGGTGADRLYGDDGNDVLIGGAGRDKLVGGRGRNILLQ